MYFSYEYENRFKTLQMKILGNVQNVIPVIWKCRHEWYKWKVKRSEQLTNILGKNNFTASGWF